MLCAGANGLAIIAEPRDALNHAITRMLKALLTEYRQRGSYIRGSLQHITSERGPIELNFLKKVHAEKAQQWLMNIAGVGPKTASMVLLFSYQQPLFPSTLMSTG